MSKKLIIEIFYGGLGDHLFLSPIPRLFKELYPDAKVYLSYKSKFRSIQAKEMIWDMNPYFDGVSLENGLIPRYTDNLKNLNILSQLACSIGIQVTYNLEPEIYYKAQFIKEMANKTLVDLNYKSFVGSYSRKKVVALIRAEPNVVLINPPKWAAKIGKAITTESLMQYADIIYSCRKFICFTSGGATLAAAIKKPSTCLYGYGQSNVFHHSAIHKYVNVQKGVLVLDFVCSYFLRIKNKIRIMLSE